MIRTLVFAALYFVSAVSAQSVPRTSFLSAEHAAKLIQPSWIVPHVRFLADSALQGRDTGSPGYDIAANYVAAQFELLGLKPGGDHSTFFQTVNMRKSSVREGSPELVVDGGGRKRVLRFDREFFVHASGDQDGIDVSGPLLFVGYGVTAPEYHYDDYAGTDAHGKIVVLLLGTPETLPRDVRAIHSVIKDRVRIAEEHGALGCIFIMPEAAADSVREKMMRQFDATMWLDEAGHAQSIYFGDGYAIVPQEGVAAILGNQPHLLSEINERLKTGPFSFDLGAQATLRARFEHRDFSSRNVVGLLRGRTLPGEYMVYSAHLDHDGVSTFFKGDPVLHGALDNAGGIATILASARAFAHIRAPVRSILFLAVTGEEKALVGSDYFVHNPTVPRQALVADINCDNFLWYFPVHDILGIGASYSSLQHDMEMAARRVHLRVNPEITVVPHLLVMSDHFSFLNANIPAVSIFNGEKSGDARRTGSQVFADYMRDVHHTPKDSIDQAIDWQAAVTEARFVFMLGDQVANDAQRPRFNATAFFLKKP